MRPDVTDPRDDSEVDPDERVWDEADENEWDDDFGDWASPYGWRAAGADPDWLDARADDLRTFWLGSHRPSWAWDGSLSGRAFISASTLRKRRTRFPRACVPVAIDSGGFTEVTQRGGWTISAEEYAGLVQRASAQLGTVEWAAIQDWMCEDVALNSTGLTVAQHQQLTVQSYLDLVRLAPDVRWLPVLQGRTLEDYLRCWALYEAAGVDLRAHQLVGLGSVCRRQATSEIVQLVRELAGRGLRLHGFGVKAKGLDMIGELLSSADSLAWSLNGRKLSRVHGKVDSQGRNLANSQEHAEAFRRRMESLISRDGVWLLAGPSGPQVLMPWA